MNGWKNQIMYNYIFAGVAAWFYIIGAVGAASTIQEPPETFAISAVLASIFIIVGIIFTIILIKRIKKYKHYKRYLDYIMAKRKIGIEELAKLVIETPEEVMRNVSAMIQNRLIDGYINEHNEIILRSYEIIENNKKRQKAIQNMQSVPIKCEACGAMNIYVNGEENRCEYCNSYLKKK